MRAVWLSIGIVLAALVALLVLTDDRETAPEPTDIATLTRRVEALRGLRFETRPVPEQVSPAVARREGLEDLDRSYPEARRRADEEVLKLLGLIDPDVDLRSISASVFGEGVAGYYDPRSKRLRIVSGATPDVLTDMTLAHELTHALEDQRFGLDLDESATDDAALARLALIEGSATLVMQEYLLRHIGTARALGGLVSSAFQTGPDLPPFLQAQLLFPYVDGMTFVEDLVRRGGGTWKLVDLADRVRTPDSTEQILHPDKWIAVEPPLPVRLDVDLGDGWSRAAAGTWGEWQTAQLVGGAAAAGWGGDRYELWRRGTCEAPPCRSHDVLVMRWRWDSEQEAREFEAALRAAEFARDATLTAAGDTVTLVLAPNAMLAEAALGD